MLLIVAYTVMVAEYTLYGDLNPGLRGRSPGERLPLIFNIDKIKKCKLS